MPNFQDLPLVLNVAIFLVSAGLVWVAGTRLSYYADAIARRTGMGEAILGVVLLGGITSLPEIAVAGAASLGGNASLAVNNVLGGFTMQVTILAIADALLRRGALTAAIPDPAVLLQGTLGIILMAVTVAGISVGDRPFLGAGAWTWGILFLFVYSVRIVARARGNARWEVVGEPPRPEIGQEEPEVERSGPSLYLLTAVAGAAILFMGYLLSETGEALAEQTGLGSSFFGAVFLAISTSLPEISTVVAAMRLRRYVMAASDIFGTNLFDIAVIFVADLAYPGGPVLAEVGTFSVVAGLLGIFVTAVYIVGLIERRDPAFGGVGLDTLVVLAAYAGGLVLLYTLR